MRNRTALTLFLPSVFAFVGLAAGQTVRQAESLLIGPGDMLHIQVYDTPQLEQHPRVDDAGDIPLLFLGDLAVAGDTPSQAAAAISAKMQSGGLMHHPQVSVSIEKFATQDISVMGQVSKPGSYAIDTPRSIYSVLSMAGGLTTIADRNVIIRRHRDNGAQQTFFVSNAPSSALALDTQIFPGDIILVPKVNFIFVLGDVSRPGGYPMTDNDRDMSVLGILAEAGSANKTAMLSEAKLLRKTTAGYTVIPLNIASLQRGKLQEPSLEADDIIFVPFSYAKNFVLNAGAIATSAASAALFIP